MDDIDRKILYSLQRDGRQTYETLSRQVGISKSPCQTRVKRLLKDGYIIGFRAILDPAKLDLSHVAFVEVKLSDTKEAALLAFNKAVRDVVEIEQCHMIAGAFDYLLKVRTRDMVAYRRVLGEVISGLPNVENTSTHVSMQSVKEFVS
jgi:Lrp/AsnC family leucine-responsive transcriptional regulator